MARKRKTTKQETSQNEDTPFEEENNPSNQPLDDVDDLLAEMDADVVIDEPDEMLLAQEAEELSRASEDESLELLSPPLKLSWVKTRSGSIYKKLGKSSC